MNIKTLVLASAALLVVSSVAEAGYYAGADLGLAIPKKEKLHYDGEKVSFKLNDGFVGDIVGGYDFGNNIRAELDFGVRRYSMDKIGGQEAGGRLNSYALTANAFYDFNNSTKLTPFLGAGIGIARNKLKVNDMSLFSPALSGSKSDSSTKFAAQGTAGIGYKITDSLTASLAYRYFTTLSQRFEKAKYDLVSHEILLGLRYEFGACKKAANGNAAESASPVAAAVAPAAAAAADKAWNEYTPVEGANEYTIYFRNNSDYVNDSDKKILAAAVEEYKKLGEVKIKLDGSADALGTPAYNLALSERRALAVGKALSEMGISADKMLIKGEGIIGTKPNPANRRVDVIFVK